MPRDRQHQFRSTTLQSIIKCLEYIGESFVNILEHIGKPDEIDIALHEIAIIVCSKSKNTQNNPAGDK